MALLLVILFIVLPIAELYVIIQVGSWIGVLPTLGLLLVDGILGAWLAKHQGRQAWERFGIWLLIGLALYFSYGYSHSKLRPRA